MRSQADALLACDFFETVTLTGARIYVLAVIEHTHRRIRILGATPHPTAAWVTQAARNLVMDLQDAGGRAQFLIRDRNGKFPALFDAVLADAGIRVVLSGVEIPRMKSIMERWVHSCRRELLDRTLILESTPPAPRAPRVRTLLQPPPAAPRHHQQPTARSVTSDDRRFRQDHPSRHPPTTPSGRRPQRIPTRRLTRTDEIFGKHTIALRELDADAAHRLVERLVGGPLGATLTPVIASVGGNPFCLHEVAATLDRDRMVTLSSGVAELTDDTAWSRLPRSLNSAILQRLDVVSNPFAAYWSYIRRGSHSPGSF